MVLSLLLCGVAATHIVRNTLYVDILSYMPKKLSKTSGLAILNGDVWTHNETFDDNKLYLLNHDLTGIAQVVTINNIRNHDWEAIYWYGIGKLLIIAERNPLNKAVIGIVDVQKLLDTGE